MESSNLSDDSSEDESMYKARNFYTEESNFTNRPSYNDCNMYSDGYNDPNNYSPGNNFNEENNYFNQSSHSESDNGSPSNYQIDSHADKRKVPYSDSEDEEFDKEQPQSTKFKYEELATTVDDALVSSDKAKAMMMKMGYREGEGLGKKSQGRVNPIEMSRQRGRRGLGLKLPGLEPANLKWDSRLEVVKVEEDVTWLDGSELDDIPIEVLESWLTRGAKTLEMDGFTDFCDSELLKNVLQSKSVFDSLDGEELRRARTRSNPFETIGKGIFQNRAAMKMANMDKVFDFMFTEPVYQNGRPQVGEEELLYFADVCAGPGGFSEYVLWRKKWRAKGFGFTLKNENDFKLTDFYSGPVESFEPYYGVKGDGNVFDPQNIESLMHFIMDQTDQLGVHFMMADGGFSVDGQENIQEILSKQLYLCQCLVALSIVRKGGHFVCKLFDIFSPFSVGIVYLMYRSFSKISIHKPNTSRPANSERYIICKWKRDDCDAIRRYMYKVNEELCKLGSSKKHDITHVVPLEEMMADRHFCDYIVQSNNMLGERQIINLVKIQAFCRDTTLLETRQADIRKSCLIYWDVPDRVRRADKRVPEEVCDTILKKCDTRFLTSLGENLTCTADLENCFKSLYDWHCLPMGNKNECYFFIGLGRSKIFRLASGGKYWTKVDNTKLELSPGTLVYAEIVQEVSGESRSQRKISALHIIDAITLGDEKVSHFHYTKRLQMCSLFVKALEKSNRSEHCPVRVKHVYPLESIKKIFEGLSVRQMKSGSQELIFGTESCAFQIKGIMFFRATKDPYMRHLSRSTGYHYYARPDSKDSKYDKDRPPEACASTMDCIERRKLWWWEGGVGLLGEEPKEGTLHKNQLSHFINSRVPARGTR